MEIYKGIGLMSGTSLDGIDLVYCLFILDKNWTFTIERAETIPYHSDLRQKLQQATELNSYELAKLDGSLGHYMGAQVRQFIEKNKLQPDFIASHGHTIFHQPGQGYTLQIGDGNAITKETRLPVIYNFRSLDVALGGQGAPLVPIGDRLLFAEYAACLNLGGIANISFEKNEQRIAFDICPVNMVLNYLTEKIGFPFDDQGKIARSGKLDQSLLTRLNALPYYQLTGPRSIGKEWVYQQVIPLLERNNKELNDILHTFCFHIAYQITRTAENAPAGKLLISGGGAYNAFLIEQIKELSSHEIVIPSQTIIEFKEALIFALLGVLRLRGEDNTLASVTGATSDSCGGVIAGIAKI